jgi:O-antigen ligase
MAGVAGWYLVGRPPVALAAVLGAVVVVESDPVGLLPIGPRFYEPMAFGLTAPDLLLGALLAGVALELARTRTRPQLPGPLTLPLLFLTAALAAGVVTGYFAGADPVELYLICVRFAHLLLLPVLVVNVVRGTGALRTFAAGAAVLAGYKAVTGLAAIGAGAGFSVEGGTITFYEPTANWLLLMLILAGAAAWVGKVQLPAWVWTLLPLALGALLLSYRRSFWVAAAFALVLVLVVASRQRLRTALAILAVGLFLAVVGTSAVGSTDQLPSPIVERAESLRPDRITSDSGDRYRIDEQRNVIEEIRRHPVTGLGLAVPWAVRHPLAQEHDRKYTHVVVLWFWLKLGLLGVAAYAWLMVVGLAASWSVWRRHPDGVVRVGALAAMGSLVALAIVELTASFTGVEPRLTTALGAVLGWLAAAHADADDQSETAAVT